MEANEQSQLSPEQLLGVAETMQKCSDVMNQKLESISKIVTSVESTSLHCEAGTEIANTMRKLNTKIAEYKEVTDTYVKWLKDTHGGLVATFDAIKSNTQGFNDI